MDHYYGYAAAELFVRDNPEFMQQISCIFRMPDDEVKERYFSNNKYQRLYESVKERLRMLKQAMGPEEQLPEKPVLQ